MSHGGVMCTVLEHPVEESLAEFVPRHAPDRADIGELLSRSTLAQKRTPSAETQSVQGWSSERTVTVWQRGIHSSWSRYMRKHKEHRDHFPQAVHPATSNLRLLTGCNDGIVV